MDWKLNVHIQYLYSFSFILYILNPEWKIDGEDGNRKK